MDKNWTVRYGKWALVTGASSGLGADFARQLAEKGMNVILVARRVHNMEEIAREIEESYGIKTLVIGQDLTEPAAVENIKDRVGEREIGILVNNAGYGLLGKFHENDSDYQKNMVTLNCYVPVALTGLFINQMVERGRGAVIFLASTAAYQGVPYFSVYSATKSFNLYLAEGLWGEYKKLGIDVLALSPGFTGTEFQSHAHMKRIRGPKPARSPDVVKLALRKLNKRASVVHGVMNRIGAFMSRLLPRKTVISISGAVMKMARPGL
ncbi:MAG: SDR family oxidoreductase [Candidatus Marinimicrobia bacterium]|nr:SDR family oxidoreductase [Candidatus Neomarinimicrobiota bacterium]